MFFTVLLIRKNRKKFVNAEELELNYHRFFMKRYGLIKGAFLSVIISTTAFYVLLLVSGERMVWFIFGACSVMAYINGIQYFMYDSVDKRLVRKNANTKQL
jgi:4-hydroxybenzoate polyprenyltransferase